LVKKQPYFWIPQTLTGLRLMAGPVVLWALLGQMPFIAFSFTVIAGLTDWLDGVSARYFKIESKFGRLFDPLADKIFITFLCFGFIITRQIPLWLPILIIIRDVFIVLGASYIRKNHIPHPLTPILISKYNTFLQMCLIGWLLLEPLLPYFSFFPTFSNVLIYGTLTTTLVSGYIYAKIFYRLYRASLLH
jgi:cardiolipin synthase